jgi:hypothetical protein
MPEFLVVPIHERIANLVDAILATTSSCDP